MKAPQLHLPCEKNASRLRCLVILTSFSICVTLLWLAYVTNGRMPLLALSLTSRSSTLMVEQSCRNVLQTMLRGTWHQQELTSSQHFDMKMFHMKVRIEHGLPPGLQRPDLLCGNVTFGPYAPVMHPLLWYRALCDDDGATPCCYNNRCSNHTKEQCTCPECYDMRRAVQAEYALWWPSEPTCEVRSMPPEQVCSLLQGATLYFIGDSYVRHVFTALLLAARGNELSGAIQIFAPPGIKAACTGIYMFTEKLCRHWLDRHTSVCQGRTKVRFFELVYIKQAEDIHNTILQLANVTRGFVFVGTGVHDNFKANETQTKVLLPVLQRLRNASYPKILWASTHAPGLMKTPRIQDQSSESVRSYNAKMEEFLRPWGVPVFDTFNLTDGVMSFDGAHYGLGVNRVKVRILLAYLMELRQRHLW